MKTIRVLFLVALPVPLFAPSAAVGDDTVLEQHFARTAQQQGRHVLETIKTLLRGAWSGEELALLIDTS